MWLNEAEGHAFGVVYPKVGPFWAVYIDGDVSQEQIWHAKVISYESYHMYTYDSYVYDILFVDFCQRCTAMQRKLVVHQKIIQIGNVTQTENGHRLMEL